MGDLVRVGVGGEWMDFGKEGVWSGGREVKGERERGEGMWRIWAWKLKRGGGREAGK